MVFRMLKKLINKPGNEVREMLEGMSMAFPEIIRLDNQWNNVYRAYKKANKVALVSGGGSGHEPPQLICGLWYARRSLRGSDFHLAHRAPNPGFHKGGLYREGGSSNYKELLRRRYEL